MLKGKLAYTAPETIETGRTDRRTDVFSMGVVLYQATLGRLPFFGDRDAVVMAAILTGAAPRLRDLDAAYPRELEAIVLRAIASDPEERFPTAEALGRSLEEWLARSGAPIIAPPTSVERQIVQAEVAHPPASSAPWPAAPAFSSYPPAPTAFESSRESFVPTSSRESREGFLPPSIRPPPTAPHARAMAASNRPLILVSVAFIMCAALGVMGSP